MSMTTLQQLNAMSSEEFTACLGGVFEHSPWVAERTAAHRPFTSRLTLLEHMRAVVAAAPLEEQLALIRAHPELAGKAAVREELTEHSSREQRGAGLKDCTSSQFARLQELNASYRERFGFPFILAVRGHDVASILRSFEERLGHTQAQEHSRALYEIGLIAGFRLVDWIVPAPGAEIMAMLERLASYSERAGQLTCSFLTPAHRITAAQLREWLLAAGLEVEIDAIGNVVGWWRSRREGAKTLLVGSHYDTVINAGRYDGRLGIVLPIVAAQRLRQRGVELPFHLQVVAFGDEEGVRFQSTFLGSSALAGTFDLRLLEAADEQGTTLRAALLAAGLDPEQIPQLARAPSDLLGYVEIHIEQGPVLLNAKRALGVVTSIAGSLRYRVVVHGTAGHAGTVPMSLRQDAAAAAAEIVLAVEARCKATPGLVGTVGCLAVPEGAINVIPGRCELSIDLRAAEDATRDAAWAAVAAAIVDISLRRGVRIELHEVLRARAVPCSPAMQGRWAKSITQVTGEAAPMCLPSGAGHDAMQMAAVTEVGMLFVRCGNGGISHHPDESVDVADVELAARAFEDLIMQLAAETSV
jgi:allantoate deiminase/N-carbamoyl-L-amino-acid hydrolase